MFGERRAASGRELSPFSNRLCFVELRNSVLWFSLDIQVKWMSTWMPSEENATPDIARHTRSDDPPHPRHDGAAACVWHCQQAPAGFRRRPESQPGHHLSGPHPAGAARLDARLLGQDGE